MAALAVIYTLSPGTRGTHPGTAFVAAHSFIFFII
jgi:hypothetical protein